MKKRGLFVTCFLIAVMSLTVFNSCDIDIGLGAAIDTEVPTISIENPPTDAIIRDAFVISGNYSDDGEISSISLDLKNTENKKSYSFPGKFDDVSNWSAEINPLDEKTRIPDGKYEVKITISDKGGHKSNTTRSFVIDNTAPVLVLSRPSSKDDEKDANKIESYGQNLTLKGQVSDTNNVERLVIDFYSEDNPDKSLYTETIQNISPDIALDVAHFLDGKAYSKLFGSEIEGPEYLANIDKKFYCTVTAYDYAKCYPQKNEEDNLGNSENEYILMVDWQSFQTDYQNSKGTTLQLPDLYSIKTTRTKDGSNRSAAESSKDEFESLFGGAITKGSFKLNPKNNPTFLISTLSLEKTSDVESEQPITVQLFQGLDGIELKDADKMAVYLIPVNKDGNKIEGIKIYPQTQEYKNTGDGQINIKIIKDDCKDKSPKDKDIANAVSVNLEYGTTYILGVDGQDIKGNEILPSLDGKDYRICFKAKKQAPGLKIDNPSLGTSYIAKGKSVTISGTTSLPDGKPTISITCKIDDGDIEDIEPVELELDRIEDNQIVYKFSKTLTTEFFNQEKSHQYTFEITSDMDGWKTSISKTVIYDVDGPTISIDSMLPTAEKYTGDEKGSKEEGIYLNGKVTMKIAILDDYDSVNTEENKKPYYIITDENNNEIEKNFISTPTKQSFTINTEDLPSGKIKVKIYAEDRAGNLGVDIDDPENTSFERIYIVDQSTDAPVILPYNYESVTLTHSTKDSIESAITKNDFRSVLTTGSSIQFRLIDDDGIKNVTFKIGEKDSDEDLENKNVKPVSQNNQNEIIYSHEVPTSIGRYKCAITVEDTNGKSTTKTFWIVTTGAAPQVSISRTEPNNKIITMATDDVNAKTEFVNTLEIDSAYEKFSVSRFEKIKINGIEKDVETVLYGTDTEENDGLYGKKLTEKTFTDTFKPAVNRSTNKVRYVVTDEMGHSSPEREFIYDVDNTAPVIAQNTIVVPNVTQTEGLSFRFQATATDTPASTSEKESGISKIQYTFDESKANLREIPGVSSLTETVLFGDSELAYAFESEGEKTIYVRAIDDVGNIGQWTPKTFIYDTGAPTLEINSYTQKDRDSVTISDTSVNSLEVSDEFTLGGKVYDENGIEKFEIWQMTEGTSYEEGNTLGVKLFESTNPNKQWSIGKLPRNEANLENPAVNSGSYIYTIKAIDKAGKTATKTITAKIDKTAPVVTIDLAEGNTNDSTAYGENSIKGSAFTFRGTITDPLENNYASRPAQLYYAFNKTGLAPALSDYLSISPLTDNWNIPMTLGTGSAEDTSDTLYEGKKYLWVYGTDKAGNQSSPISVAFMIDQAEPVSTVSVDKVRADGTSAVQAENGTYTINKASGASKYILRGIVSDANGISRVTVDGSIVPVQNGNWNIEITQQGKKNHSIVVYDNSGKTAASGKSKESTVSVIFDTNDPDLSVDGLDVTNLIRQAWVSGTGDYYINGTAGDGNENTSSGIKELKISIDNGNFIALPLSSSWSYKYQIPSNFSENEDSDESYHTVTVKAVDNAGNEKSKIYYFRYDKTQPFAELNLDKNAQYVKSTDTITFSGYVHDGQEQGREVESATIIVKKDGVERSDLAMNILSDDSFNYVRTPGSSFGNFEKTVLASTFNDGSYEFTLQVTDKAGNSPSAISNLTGLLFVDKTNPSISGTELTDWNETHSRAKVNVTFTDSNPDSAYYYVNDYSDTSISGYEDVNDNDWISIPVSAGSNTYLAYRLHSFNDGNGEVYTKIVDKAGNISYGETQTFTVDTKAPDVCTLETVDGLVLNGTKLINGENSVTIKVTASDYNDNRLQSTGLARGNDVSKVAGVNLTKLGARVYEGAEVVLGQPSLTGQNNNEKTGEWTIIIPSAKFSGLETGSYPVTVTVTDLAGNKKDFQLFTFDIDTVKPTITNWNVESAYDAGTRNSVRTYYMNNNKEDGDEGLKISGIAWDDREIDTVTLTVTGTNAAGEVLNESQTSSQAAWNFSIEKNEWKNWKNYADVTISVKDKAKNNIETPVSFRIIFDTEGPSGKHLFDESGKDLYLRVGEQSNDDINENSTSPEWSNALDTDVGGKYSDGAFGNKETIKIRGNFDDGTGSGVKMIYYKLFTSEPTPNEINTFVREYENLSISDSAHVGYISPLSASSAQNSESRVFYNADSSNGNLGNKITPAGSVISVAPDANNATKYYVNIIPTFKTMITGFKPGHNYLVLVAVDNVGNAKVDETSSNSNYYTINVDTQAPEITANEDIYTQATEDLQLEFTVEDRPEGQDAVAAGVRSVTVKMNGVEETKTATFDGTKWGVTIPVAELPSASGSYAVSVTAVDNAGDGNSDTRPAGTVIIDKEDPQLSNIKFEEVNGSSVKNAYSDGSSYYVNNRIAGKTFRVSGIASDNNGIRKVELSVENSTDTSEALKPQVNNNVTNGNWTFAINGIQSWTNGAHATVTVTDKSGRTHSEALNIVFDTAVPTVNSAEANFKVPTVSEAEGSLFKFEGFAGNVADTGSGLDKVELAFNAGATTAPTAAQASVTPGANGTWSSTVEFANSAFTGVFNTQGTKYLWVRAYDKAGNASAWTQAKSFVYDTAAPTISFTASVGNKNPASGSYRNSGFILEVDADDSNGVEKVEIYNGGTKIADAAETASGSKKYAAEFVVGEDNAEAANYLADGSHNFTVKVTDKAEKTNSVTINVTIDTVSPTGEWASSTPAGTVAGSGTNAKTWYKTSSIKFAYAISDTEANIDTVKISKNNIDWESMSLSNGVYAATLTDFTEGSKTITVEMKDLAGNTNTATKTIYVDTTEPTISTDTSTVLSYMPSAGFTISGSVNDTSTASIVSGVKSLKVKEERKAPDADGFSETTESNNGGVAITVTDGSWNRHLPLGTLEDGVYQYTLILMDEAGNQSTKTFTTKVDTTAPTLSFTNPTNKTGTGAINASPYMFSGNVVEANEIRAIYYQILSDGATAPSAPDNPISGSWTGWTSVTPEANWSFYRDIKTGTNAIAEGKYKIYMYALDGAGNLSDSDENTTENQPYVQEFHVDTANPVVEITTVPEYVNYTTDSTNHSRTVTISGTVRESQLDTFYIKRNGETGNGTLVSVNATDGSWTYTDTPTANGTYTYTFTATDKVGKTNTELTKTVVVDTAVPTVNSAEANFKVPTVSEAEGSLFKFEGFAGNVADTGSGLDKVELAFTSDTTAPTAAQASVTPGANGTWSSTVEFANSAFTGVFNSQGTKYLWVRAYDKAGNASEWTQAKSFVYDTAAPTISFTESAGNKNPTSGSYRNSGFTLEVSAADTYEVDKVEVLYGDQTVEMSLNSESGKYEKTFRAGSETTAGAVQLTDGSYNFTVKVTDKAEKTAIVTKSVNIDTNSPVIDMTNTSVTGSSDYTDTNSVGWRKSNQIPVSVSVTDSGAGIGSVQISTDTEFTNPTSLMQSESGRWTGTIVCGAQGVNTIYIKATDAVGNATNVVTANSLTVYIDTTAPADPIFLGISTGSGDSLTATPSSQITSVLVNKTVPVTVYAALVDDGTSSTWTGIPTEPTAAALKQKGKSGTSTYITSKAGLPAAISSNLPDDVTYDYKFWSYEIATADMRSGGVNFTVKDNIGNEADYVLFQLTVDNTVPTATLNQIANLNLERETSDTTTYVNGTITLSGTANDNQKLDSVKVEYKKQGDANWTEITAVPSDDSLASWTRTLDTTTLEDEALYDIRVSATDVAGNTTDNSASSTTLASRTQIIKVSQDTDRPIIKFTNLELPSAMSADDTISFRNEELYGFINDDDGVPTSLEYYYGTGTPTDSDWKTDQNLSYSSGSFTLKFKTADNKNDDGTHHLYFRVTDASGTTGKVFTSQGAITSATTLPAIPKIIDNSTSNKYGYITRSGTGTVTYASPATVTYLTVDTTDPYRGNLKFSTNYTATTPTWQEKTDITALPFGGNRKSFKVKIPAWDVNGVTISMTIEDYTETITFTETTESAGDAIYTQAKYWESSVITIPTTMETGVKACSIDVFDGVRHNKDDFSISVDNTVPVINAAAPSSTQNSSGNVIAYGETDLQYWKNTSSTDNPREYMYYALSLDDTTEPAENKTASSDDSANTITSWKQYTNAGESTVTTAPAGSNATISYKPYYSPIKGGSFSWYVHFDGVASTDGETHDETFKQFLIDSGITTLQAIENTNQSQKFKAIVRAYLWIKAVDQVGNETVIKHPILIDPQGDAPKVTIDYPEAEGTTLGDEVTLRGSAIDTLGTTTTDASGATVSNIGVESVWVQLISAKYNGYDSTTSTTSGARTAGGLSFSDTVTPSTENGTTTYSHEYSLTDFAPTMKDVKQWINAANGSGQKVYEVYTGILTDSPTRVTAVGNGDAWADTADGSDYYIKVSVSGSSWNLKINSVKEFDPAEGQLNPVAYRVFAEDKDGNLSSYEQQLSVFDSDNPIVGTLYLRQYSNNAAGTGTVTASRLYEDDVWVKGKWWLYGSVKDTQGLSSLKINGNTVTITGTSTNSDTPQEFNFELDTDVANSAGNLTVTIIAEDNATNQKHKTTKPCSINYDNVNPTLLPSTGEKYNISTSVKNSNGFYSFGSQVTENPVNGKEQSGFDYLAFWFERNITGKRVVYDVMKPKVSGENTSNSEVPYSSLTLDSGLMWKTKTGVGRSSTARDTLTLSAADDNIHTGGLCKVAGSIYIISNISEDGKTITINGQPEYTSATETVKFAIANVVNNNVEAGSGAKNAAGYYNTLSNDDGDHMVESVSKQGAVWTWEANINSQNIADGSIILHYVAFDKAGNLATADVSNANVENNAPRLASLKVWSDFNENTRPDEGESETFYNSEKPRIIDGVNRNRATALTSELVVSGNKKDYDKDGSSFMTVKANTRFIPEIVGGNGALYYSYRYKKNKTDDWKTVAYSNNSIGNGFSHGIDDDIDDSGYNLEDDGGSAFIQGRTDLYAENYNGTKYYMEIPGAGTANSYSLNGIGNSNSTADPTWFEYTIYDSTEGCAAWGTSPTATSTTGRLSTKFRVALNLQYVDSTPPVTVISPLYWKSSSDNSVYHDINGTTLGHVELKSDLVDENGDANCTLGTTYGTDDDKVSGIVVFRGFAYDNKKLTELKWGLVDHAESYTSLDQSLQSGATFNGTSWDGTDTDYYTFTVSNAAEDGAYHNQNGHKVAWTLTLDTSHFGVAENKRVVVQATDSQASTADTRLSTITNDSVTSTANPETAPATYDAGTYNPTYKIDILPYITNIVTSLSSLKANNPSVYSRTALGHYSVRVGETVTFEGFNLGTKTTLTISDSMSSAAYEFKVGNIKAMNNLNNNDARGSYTKAIVLTDANGRATSGNKTIIENYYNRQPNGDNNNLLTDDIWFDVWQFNDRAAVPITGKIEQPVMKIRPTDGKIGFAFVNGPLYFSMGGSQSSQDYSYQYWTASYDFFTSVGFTYDDLGNSWGVAAGGDINDSQSDAFTLMSSKFGIGGHDRAASYDGTNSLRLERIGQIMPSGTSYIRKVIQLDAAQRTGIWIKPVEGEETATVQNDDILYFCNEDGTLINNTAFRIFGKWPDNGTYSNNMLAFQITDTTNNINQAPATASLGKTLNDYTRWNSGYENGDRDNSTNIEKDNLYVKIINRYQGFDKQRIQNPSLVTSTNGANTNVYLAYYDALNDEIRFKSGTSTEIGKKNFGQFNDSATAAMPNYDATNVSIIAGASAAYKNTGSYLNLGVIPASVTGSKDTVIAVWLDQTTNPALPTLYYAYNNDPIANPGNWTYVGRILPENSNYAYAGEYCKVAVDSYGGVHIAAYDSKNLDLVYAYLPANKKGEASSTDDFVTCVVDSNGVLGSNLTLDVGKVSTDGNVIPYIGYYSTSSIKPKMAYYVGGFASDTTSITEGSNNDAVTGAWECVTIPTASTVEMQSNQHNDINIGLWKENGVIVDSTTSTKYTTGADTTVNQANGYASTSYGQVYGNGSKNAILGYVIKYGTSDHIETAQMK